MGSKCYVHVDFHPCLQLYPIKSMLHALSRNLSVTLSSIQSWLGFGWFHDTTFVKRLLLQSRPGITENIEAFSVQVVQDTAESGLPLMTASIFGVVGMTLTILRTHQT